MIDREKIIKALECCDDSGSGENLRCADCPYKDVDAGTCETIHTLHADVLKLLKEQEPVKPIFDEMDVCGCCGECGHSLTYQKMYGDNVLFEERYDYCPACGRKVKWSE